MNVISVTFLVVITADLALAIGMSTKGNLSPPSEPAKEDQYAMTNNLQSMDDVKRENMKKTINLTSSFIENDDAVDYLASKYIKDHGSGQFSKGELKESIKKLSQFIERDGLKNVVQHTPKERFDNLVKDLTSLSHMTSTFSEFQLCNSIIEKMPDDFLANNTIMNAMMTEFGDKCIIVNSENPLPDYLDSFELCSHLSQVLKLHLSFGLPDYVESNSQHFCTYLVDMVFPSVSEPPCLRIMEQMQYQYAKDKALNHLIPYPSIVLIDDFEDTFMEVCTSSVMGNKTEDFCDGSFKKIKETTTTQEALKDDWTMTILQYTNHFCSSVNFSLPHPGNSLLEKNKPRKHGTRNAISHVFSLAQGYRHGILDSTGKIIQSENIIAHANASLQSLGLNEAQKQIACSGRAYSGAVGGSVSLGPISFGGGLVHGWGNNNDEFPDRDKSDWYYAEGNFKEFCFGVSPGDIEDAIKVLNDNTIEGLLGSQGKMGKWGGKAAKLFNIGIDFSIGWVKNFGNLPGKTIVNTADAGIFIFSMSASEINCCGDDGCPFCGAAFGIGFFLPPSSFSIGFGTEVCLAEAVGTHTTGRFKRTECAHYEYLLFLNCTGGPYHMITISIQIGAQETLIFKGTICEENQLEKDPIQKITLGNNNQPVTIDENNFETFIVWQNIPFSSPQSISSTVTYLHFRNHLPGQTVRLNKENNLSRRKGEYNSWTIANRERIGNWRYSPVDETLLKDFDILAGPTYTFRIGWEHKRLHFSWDNPSIPQPVPLKDKCERWGLSMKDCCALGCYWNGTECPSDVTSTGPGEDLCGGEDVRSKKWIHCASQNGLCYCNGNVRYGTDNRWNTEPVVDYDGSILCADSVFGDPAPGTRKSCQCDESCQCDDAVRAAFSCIPGQGAVRRATYEINKPSRESCEDYCRNRLVCVAFDYTHHSRNDACRIYDSSENSRTDPGYHKRMWCVKDCKDGGFNPNGNACLGDPESSCPDRASSGECQANPHYMRECCRKSCNVCEVKKWIHCSSENELCYCDGNVRYGAGNKWTTQPVVEGKILCANSVFGDPNPNVQKSCQCDGEVKKWFQCSSQNEICYCNGNVRYGVDKRWNEQPAVGGEILCSDLVLGDPAPGVRKSCQCDESCQCDGPPTQAPTPTPNCAKYGKTCVFPFVYRGRTFNTCTDYNAESPWCALTSNYESGKWEWCDETCWINHQNGRPSLVMKEHHIRNMSDA